MARRAWKFKGIHIGDSVIPALACFFKVKFQKIDNEQHQSATA